MSTHSKALRYAVLSGVSLACLLPAFAQETAPETTPATEEDGSRLVQQTIQVRGQFIPDEKRSTSEVSSLLDTSDFSLSGDSDAASALSRVAGISTAQNRFVYVRGLNERYSSATLNGSPLPSPEPLRRVAPLDLFPTSVLESILVQKTFSPNLPGEFGGGLVDIRTRAVPDEAFFEAKIGISGDSETSFKDGLLYDGSDTDWLGFDDGARDLPAGSDAPDAAFGLALVDNSSLLIQQNGEVGPEFSVGFTGGERYDLNNQLSMGLLGSFSYSNDWSTKKGIKGFADSTSDGGLSERFQKKRYSTQNEIGVNGYAAVGFEYDRDRSSHEIQFTGLITRSTEKGARTVQGFDFDDNFERSDDIEFFERQLWTTQASGKHIFDNLNDLKIEWRGSYSEAFRDAPYQFSVLYQNSFNGLGLTTVSNGANNTFGFSHIDDDSTDFGIDATLPIVFGGGCAYFCDTDLKVGYSYVESDRDAVSQLFALNSVPRSDRRIDYVYTSTYANPNANVQSIGGNTFPERYLATLEVDAAYFQVDTQITPYIRGAVGGRFESAIQAVDTQTLDQDPTSNYVESCVERQADSSCKNKEDFLPAVTLTWNPIEDLQIRGGYSETITRPQFRELAPTEFLNTETNQNFLGNPFLVNAAIKNWDLRGEYYFSRGQFLTFGLFYKDMERPIEEVTLLEGDEPKTTFLNVPSAELYGVEFEYEQTIPVSSWVDWKWLASKEFTLKTNYTWSDSKVSAGQDRNKLGLSNTEFCAQFASDCVIVNGGNSLNPVPQLVSGRARIEDGRRLQGQSEHLFNIQFGYTDDDANSDVNLLFNFASERIRSAEALNLNIPAILEQPPMTIDFVYNKRFDIMGREYEVSLNLENLLGDDYEAYQERGGDKIFVDTYDIGQSVSISLKKEF